LFSIIVNSLVKWTLFLISELGEGDPEFQHLAGEEVAADVVKASVMEEGSDNELGEWQESAIKRKLLSLTGDSIGAVIIYVGSSINRIAGML
jgi:hypothetical protein